MPDRFGFDNNFGNTPSPRPFKVGDRVAYRATSGFCSMEWTGRINYAGSLSSHVVFDDGGGGWYDNTVLIKKR